MLSTGKKTAHSMGTGKPAFWIWLFGKHLPSQNLEPREEGDSSGAWPLLQPSLFSCVPNFPAAEEFVSSFQGPGADPCCA